MKYKKFFFPFLFVLFSMKGFSVNMNVSIFSDLKVSSFSVKIKAGKYTLIDKGNSEKNIHLQKNDSVNFTISNKHIFVSVRSEKKVQYDSLEMKGAGINAFFSIYLLKPSLKEVRSYEDNLDLYVANENFLIVNTIELEKYISGVVECEGGNLNAGEEFLKVQAIICRSYAVKNMKKHIKEGYQLCDQVHCQVYRGKCKDKSSNIRIATYKTSGDVIVNDDNEIISATFHSNSGGQTVNSEDIWNKPLPYLRSVTDSFSMKNQHTNWEKKINKMFDEMLHLTADRQLIIAEFRSGPGKIPPFYVDNEIDEVIQRDYAGDRNRFHAALRAEGTTPLGYRKIIEDQIIIREMQREIRVAAMQIGPGKVAEYYETHKADYIRKEQIRLRQITLRPGAAERPEEAKARAEAWADALRHPEKINATLARFKVNTTKLNTAPTFGDIAERISGDDFAKQGGDTGWRNVEDLNEKMIAQVKDLPVGQASTLLQIDQPGSPPFWFIFVREGSRPKGYLPLSDPELLREIEDKVSTESVKNAIDAWLTSLRSKHYVEIVADKK